MEKRNYINKTISKVVNDDGQEINNQTDILNEIKTFYQKLYTNNDSSLHDVDLDNLLFDCNVPRLTENDKSFLEQGLTKAEILQSLKACKNNKTPGTTGFTAEFYNFFLVRHWRFPLPFISIIIQ